MGSLTPVVNDGRHCTVSEQPVHGRLGCPNLGHLAVYSTAARWHPANLQQASPRPVARSTLRLAADPLTTGLGVLGELIRGHGGEGGDAGRDEADGSNHMGGRWCRDGEQDDAEHEQAECEAP
jgi:hypothetical protein